MPDHRFEDVPIHTGFQSVLHPPTIAFAVGPISAETQYRFDAYAVAS